MSVTAAAKSPMMQLRRAPAIVLTVSLLAVATGFGCRSFGRPPAALLHALGAQTQPTASGRAQARVTLRSPQVSGEFHGLLVATRTPTTKVRMLLLPDLGSRILDVIATQDRLWGTLPGGQQRLDVVRGRAAPRRFLTFAGLTLLEAHIPVDESRITGARATAAGWQVHLTATFPRLRVLADIDTDGQVIARHYRYRGVSWSEYVSSDSRTIEGSDFEMTIDQIVWEDDPELPEALFLHGSS
ncbi:MAG: hypothetical protein AAF581_16855 [Planctomycetota bacterium]